MEHSAKDFADYVAAVKRRFTVVLVSFVVVFVAGVYVAYSLPAIYRSTGLISVDQPNVSRDLVEATAVSDAKEHVEVLWQKVMSSESLSAVIEKYDIYPNLVARDPSLRIAVEELRSNTFLEAQADQLIDSDRRGTSSSTTAFTLSFDNSDAMIAQRVATELASLYLKEDTEGRTSEAQGTSDFLQLEMQSARAQADQASDELARFKERHAGNLPELLNFHLQSIERTEQQLDDLGREIRDARNRQFLVETELAKTNPFGNAVDVDGNPILGTAERLAQLQAERLRLLSIYTPAHSDVLRIEREIEILTGGGPAAADPVALRTQLDGVLTELQEARLKLTEDHPDVIRLSRTADALKKQLEQARVAGPQQQNSLSAIASRDPVVQQLRQQVQTEQSYIQSLLRRRGELEGKLDELRGRVAAMPQIEREYEVLTQQNEVASARYNEAVERVDTAERAQTLDAEAGGRRLTLLEAPFLPEQPYSPDRPPIVMLAVMVALGIGIGLAILIDNLDESIKSSADLEQITGAPPLAVIPVLETESDRRRRFVATVAKSAFFAGGLATALGIATAMSG